MIDLGKFNTAKIAENTAEIELEFNGNGTGIYFSVKSDYETGAMAETRKRVNKKIAENAKGKPAAITAEQLNKERAERLSGQIVGWRCGDLKDEILIDGEKVKYSKAAAFDLLSREGFFWIASQIDEFVGDIANFMKT